MAHPQPESERILEGETLRGVEREYRDLVLSLKALAALLREEPAEDHVLPRLLEAELNQLSVLVGEMCTALKVEDRGARIRRIDLAQAVDQATRRSGVHVVLGQTESVAVEADPEIASQVIQSALALSVRMADSPVSVRSRRVPGGGEVLVEIPVEMRGAPSGKHRDTRLHMLRQLVALEGGRLVSRRKGLGVELRLWFPAALTVAGE